MGLSEPFQTVVHAEYPRMERLKAEIAAAAAGFVVEEGLEYGPAKHRAVKTLGLPARSALPDNAAVEDAVLDGPNSIVIAQANNRTWAAQAVVKKVLEGL